MPGGAFSQWKDFSQVEEAQVPDGTLWLVQASSLNASGLLQGWTVRKSLVCTSSLFLFSLPLFVPGAPYVPLIFPPFSIFPLTYTFLPIRPHFLLVFLTYLYCIPKKGFFERNREKKSPPKALGLCPKNWIRAPFWRENFGGKSKLFGGKLLPPKSQPQMVSWNLYPPGKRGKVGVFGVWGIFHPWKKFAGNFPAT